MRLKSLFFVPILFGSLLLSNCFKKDKEDDPGGGGGGGNPTWPQQTPLPEVTGSATITMAENSNYVNVMGDFMPRMPAFPQAKKKVGKLCGYVADLSGKPLKGVFIGVRSLGVTYTARSGTTDDNGYYEIDIPSGATQIYPASYLTAYGEPQGKAPLTLHSADGHDDMFDTKGDVRNFVVLTYGLADASRRAAEPFHASGYYGGSLLFWYRIWDTWTEEGLPVGAELEIKLTPVDGTTFYGEKKEFIIKRKVIAQDVMRNFYINNIPVGQYTISAKLNDGRPLKMSEPVGEEVDFPHHGLSPSGLFGTTKVFFTPAHKFQDRPNVNLGAWKSIDMKLSLK